MSGYSEHFASHLRLVMLRVLDENAGYTANTSFLRMAAGELGVPASDSQVRTEAAWLVEQGLVTAKELPMGVTVLTLTARGQDVATGMARVPGVQRPGAR